MLDAYLTGSVGQLMERARHLQASISRQLAVPKNLPPEFHTLAQTCRNEVNNLVFDLGSLLSDSRFKRADLQAIRLRAYKRIVEELDFLELVGIAALMGHRTMLRLVCCARLRPSVRLVASPPLC